jgi:AcrR family transcriptional regulator
MADIASATGVLPGSLYHHFASKEDIAIAIVAQFEREMGVVYAEEEQADPATDPETGMRRFAAKITAASLRNAAAVRLLSYEPPTVASEQMKAALLMSTAPQTRLWKRHMSRVRAARAVEPALIPLLGFALGTSTLLAPVTYTLRQEPERLAALTCDVLFEGIAVDSPMPVNLERSPATAAAHDVMATWPQLEAPAQPGSSAANILFAAKREFARRGYHATTVRDIAEAAGVRMGTLYRRIESKEALLEDILQSYSTHMGTAIRAALEAGNSPIESIDAYARVFIHGRRRFPLEMEIVKYGASGRDTPGSPFQTHYQQTSARRAALEAVIADGLANGAIKKLGSPAELADQIRAISWLPYRDLAPATERKALEFFRRSVLEGLWQHDSTTTKDLELI